MLGRVRPLGVQLLVGSAALLLNGGIKAGIGSAPEFGSQRLRTVPEGKAYEFFACNWGNVANLHRYNNPSSSGLGIGTTSTSIELPSLAIILR